LKTELDESLALSSLLLSLLVLLNDVSVSIYAEQPGEVYVYGFPESPSSETLLRYFDSKSNWQTIFYKLEDSSSSERFLKIVEMLRALGIEVTPPESCTSCELLHLTWKDILKGHASPLVGFFRNGRLTAITLGIAKLEILDRALKAGDDDVKVFALGKEYSLRDESVRVSLERLFLGEAETGIHAPSFVSSIVLLALADSVNPCTFAVFTALLFMALHALGKTKAALTGFSFILAIFVCYYILGLGFIHLLAAIPYVEKVVASVGLAAGAFTIARGLKPKFRSPVPKALRRLIEAQINKSYISPVASFALGVAASFTLLPCSSGPYVVGIGLLSALNDPIQAYLLLTLYNTIFVAPLIAILFAVLSSAAYTRKIKAFRGAKLGVMELISGLLLVIVCLYLLLS